MMYKFYFWQFAPNHHESAYICSLTRMGFPCTVIFQNDIPPERKLLGIEFPDYGGARILWYRDVSNFSEIEGAIEQGAIHVFTGIRPFRMNKKAYSYYSRFPYLKLLLVSESRVSTGFLGFLRYIDSLIFDFRIRRRINAVLAMGRIGVDWFVRTLFLKQRVFEFCYAIKTLPIRSELNDFTKKQLNIVYVGQLIERKNIYILINAIGRLPLNAVTLELYGVGPLKREIENYIQEKGLQSQCVLRGAMKNSEMAKMLATKELLILPSHWDGWGAVVNESLAAGTPVIVSDKCGSSSLKRDGVVDVFLSSNIDSLVHLIEKHLRELDTLNIRRIRSKELAENISGDAVAKYFFKIVEGLFLSDLPMGNVVAPWRE